MCFFLFFFVSPPLFLCKFHSTLESKRKSKSQLARLHSKQSAHFCLVVPHVAPSFHTAVPNSPNFASSRTHRDFVGEGDMDIDGLDNAGDIDADDVLVPSVDSGQQFENCLGVSLLTRRSPPPPQQSHKLAFDQGRSGISRSIIDPLGCLSSSGDGGFCFEDEYPLFIPNGRASEAVERYQWPPSNTALPAVHLKEGNAASEDGAADAEKVVEGGCRDSENDRRDSIKVPGLLMSTELQHVIMDPVLDVKGKIVDQESARGRRKSAKQVSETSAHEPLMMKASQKSGIRVAGNRASRRKASSSKDQLEEGSNPLTDAEAVTGRITRSRAQGLLQKGIMLQEQCLSDASGRKKATTKRSRNSQSECTVAWKGACFSSLETQKGEAESEAVGTEYGMTVIPEEPPGVITRARTRKGISQTKEFLGGICDKRQPKQKMKKEGRKQRPCRNNVNQVITQRPEFSSISKELEKTEKPFHKRDENAYVKNDSTYLHPNFDRIDQYQNSTELEGSLERAKNMLDSEVDGIYDREHAVLESLRGSKTIKLRVKGYPLDIEQEGENKEDSEKIPTSTITNAVRELRNPIEVPNQEQSVLENLRSFKTIRLRFKGYPRDIEQVRENREDSEVMPTSTVSNAVSELRNPMELSDQKRENREDSDVIPTSTISNTFSKLQNSMDVSDSLEIIARQELAQQNRKLQIKSNTTVESALGVQGDLKCLNLPRDQYSKRGLYGKEDCEEVHCVTVREMSPVNADESNGELAVKDSMAQTVAPKCVYDHHGQSDDNNISPVFQDSVENELVGSVEGKMTQSYAGENEFESINKQPMLVDNSIKEFSGIMHHINSVLFKRKILQSKREIMQTTLKDTIEKTSFIGMAVQQNGYHSKLQQLECKDNFVAQIKSIQESSLVHEKDNLHKQVLNSGKLNVDNSNLQTNTADRVKMLQVHGQVSQMPSENVNADSSRIQGRVHNEDQDGRICQEHLEKGFCDGFRSNEKTKVTSDVDSHRSTFVCQGMDVNTEPAKINDFINPHEQGSTNVLESDNTTIYSETSSKLVNVDEAMVCGCKPPEDGSPGCGDECINRMLNVECVKETCPCGNLCSNQQFQKRMHVKIDIFHRGYGLLALEDVTPGLLIVEYTGKVIDGCMKESIGRFVNHSHNPNCRIQKWIVKGEICIGLFAMQDISKDEELTVDLNDDEVAGVLIRDRESDSYYAYELVDTTKSNSTFMDDIDATSKVTEAIDIQLPHIRLIKGLSKRVEENLKELLDIQGGICERKDSVRKYLKLILMTATTREGLSGKKLNRSMELSRILDALLKTESQTILSEIVDKNGWQLVHNLLRRYYRDQSMIPLVCKLLKVVDFLIGGNDSARVYINASFCRSKESFKTCIGVLACNINSKVQQIAQTLQDKWFLLTENINEGNHPVPASEISVDKNCPEVASDQACSARLSNPQEKHVRENFGAIEMSQNLMCQDCNKPPTSEISVDKNWPELTSDQAGSTCSGRLSEAQEKHVHENLGAIEMSQNITCQDNNKNSDSNRHLDFPKRTRKRKSRWDQPKSLERDERLCKKDQIHAMSQSCNRSVPENILANNHNQSYCVGNGISSSLPPRKIYDFKAKRTSENEQFTRELDTQQTAMFPVPSNFSEHVVPTIPPSMVLPFNQSSMLAQPVNVAMGHGLKPVNILPNVPLSYGIPLSIMQNLGRTCNQVSDFINNPMPNSLVSSVPNNSYRPCFEQAAVGMPIGSFSNLQCQVPPNNFSMPTQQFVNPIQNGMQQPLQVCPGQPAGHQFLNQTINMQTEPPGPGLSPRACSERFCNTWTGRGQQKTGFGQTNRSGKRIWRHNKPNSQGFVKNNGNSNRLHNGFYHQRRPPLFKPSWKSRLPSDS